MNGGESGSEKRKRTLRACSHEPGTVHYRGKRYLAFTYGDLLSRARYPRVNFIAPGQVQRHLITTNLSEFL